MLGEKKTKQYPSGWKLHSLTSYKSCQLVDVNLRKVVLEYACLHTGQALATLALRSLMTLIIRQSSLARIPFLGY